MKKHLSSFGISFLLIQLLLIAPLAEAKSEFVFPLPEGNILLTNDKAHHDTYLDFPQYSLDFQASEIPVDVETNIVHARCYTYGMPILAAADGIVEGLSMETKRHVSDSYGTSVSLRHGDGSMSLYGHLIAGSNIPYVKLGDEVKAGQIIGLMGDTGTVESDFVKQPCLQDSNYGTHLHFEVRTSPSLSKPPITLSPPSSFSTGKVYRSTTIALDPGGIYEKEHAGKYPYILSTGSNEQKAVLPSDGNPPIVKEVNFVTPKPGEWLNISIVGQHLHDQLMIMAKDTVASGQEGNCEKGYFSLLTRELAKFQCRMPLNLGPVATKSHRDFAIKIHASKQAGDADSKPLYTTKFDINYGISGTNLSPRKAAYYTPTRFTITGKNVHRTSIFYIEGCDKRDIKVLEQLYDRITLECLIQPIWGSNLESLQGKTFQHLFLFKTKSRYDEQGKNVLNDEEDLKNVVTSGYITLIYDQEERIDSIEPKIAIVGSPTTFTIQGNRLPYTEASSEKAEVSLELCPGTGKTKNIKILPKSYTPYGFDFVCTPEFNNTLVGKKKTAFNINDIHCDRINLYNWTEAEKNDALEKCYETDDRELKKKTWRYFDTFFKNLDPRKVQVVKKNAKGNTPISEQKVQVISSLYDFIKREESFQFQFNRKDGEYKNNGETMVRSVVVGSITTSNRQQQLTINGENLPKDLSVQSDECGQIATTYGSSEKFEMVCLLKKVPIQEIRVIDGKLGHEIFKTNTEIVEIYGAEADTLPEAPSQIQISITGVNLGKDIKAEAPNCQELRFQHEASKTEIYLLCEGAWGKFSKPQELPLKIFTSGNTLLFENKIPIQDRGRDFVFLKSPSKKIVEKTPTVEKKSEKKLVEVKSVSGFDFFGLNCLFEDGQETFLGDCQFSSSIIAEANVKAFFDRAKEHALLLGSFYAGLSKKAAAVSLGGIEFIPLTGEGLIAAEIPEKNLLIQGQVSGIGIDASKAVGFPLGFSLADYQGSLLLHYPTFDIKKDRAQSNMIIGLGSLQGGQIPNMMRNITEAASTIKTLLLGNNRSKANAETGEDILAALHEKKSSGTLIPSLKLFQVFELIPETLAFYENFDFVARGTLKTDPFVLKKFEDGSEATLGSNLGSFDIDLNARDGILKLQGSALDSLNLFNNDILQTDQSLFKAGLTVSMKKDEGTIDLDPVELHLPGGFASAAANAHISHIFNPKNLRIIGNIRSGMSVLGLELARAGAGFHYDPNAVYLVGDQISSGLLQLEAQLKLLILIASGKGAFTFLNNQLVMDMGGALDLSFLKQEYKLANVLSRTRFGTDSISGCYNSNTGSMTLYDPIYGKKFTLRGGLSLTSKVNLGGIFGISPSFLALSGQTTDDNRIGFKYDAEQGFFGAFSEFNQACTDAPGPEFLETIKSELPTSKTTTKANFLSKFIPQALAAEDETKTRAVPVATWDIKGWKGIQMTEENGNEVIIVDQQGKEVSLPGESFKIPGIWKFSDPTTYVINDEKAFLNSGYQFSIRNQNNEGTHFEITSILGDQKTIDTFDIPELSQKQNSLELNDQVIMNGSPLSPSKSRTESITAESLQVQAEISSQEFPEASGRPMPFPDIISSALREAVEYLSKMDIIHGYPDGSFKPEQTINRAEALKIIFESIGQEPGQSSDTGFSDVPKDAWYAQYVAAGRAKKIIEGYPDGRYRPDQPMNKAEFVKMTMLAHGINTQRKNFEPVLEQYSDLDRSAWYMPFISDAYLRNFLENSKKFKPGHGMTRGDAALIIYKTLIK